PSPHGYSPPDPNLYYPDPGALPRGGRGRAFLTPRGGPSTLPPPLPPFHASRARWFANLVIARSPPRHRQRAAQSRGGRAHQSHARRGGTGGLHGGGRGRVGALRGTAWFDRARRRGPRAVGGAGRAAQEEAGRRKK